MILYVLAIGTGLLLASGFPGQSGITQSRGWLVPFAFVPLFFSFEMLRKRNAPFKNYVTLSAVTGITTSAFAFFWVTTPMHLFGKLSLQITYSLFALYCFSTAIFYVILFSPYIWDCKKSAPHARQSAYSLAIVSALLELLCPRFFQWTIGSLMHSLAPINQLSSLFGFTFASVLVFVPGVILAKFLAGAYTTRAKGTLNMAIAASVWFAAWNWGSFNINQMDGKIKQAVTTRVSFVQPNFTFSELSSNPNQPEGSQLQSLDTLLKMTQDTVDTANKQSQKTDLVVWPESVAPFEFAWSKPMLDKTFQLAKQMKVPILAQGIEYDADDLKKNGYRGATSYSISFLMFPDGTRGPSYRKWFPIPFGEYVPGENLIPGWGDFFRRHVGNTSKVGLGIVPSALKYNDLYSAAPLICFDSILPSLPRAQSSNASIYVNQANFAWMDRSNAGAEFLELDRFRAIENGRSMLVATNTGPSAAFDPIGRAILPATALMSKYSGTVSLPVLTHQTPYSKWGDLPLIAMGSMGLILMFRRHRQT